jgi:hypothetical protein
MSTTVPLADPIQAHGQTVAQLTLQEPRGKDIAACGLPRTFTRKGDTSSMVVDAAAVHAYIVRLGNIPPSSADTISARDWMDVMGAVLGFFAPTPEKAGAEGDAPPAHPQAAAPKAPGTIAMPFQETST